MARAVLAALLVGLAPAGAGAGDPRPATPGGDPCWPVDARGRAFATCFDPGHRIEVSAGSAGARGGTAEGGTWDLRAALRWRGDVRAREGNLEWTRDQAFLEMRALAGGEGPRVAWDGGPRLRAAELLLWRGTFVRRRTSPFLLVPGPRPLRLPFPFDVGLLVEAGGASWSARAPDDLRVLPLRAAVLLDLARIAGVRRMAFGPEVSWAVDLTRERGRDLVNVLVPFTAGLVDARAETADGLLAAELAVRAGAVVRVPGSTGPFLRATLALERTVVAVNDRPVAVYLESTFRGGADGRGLEGTAGLRFALPRGR